MQSVLKQKEKKTLKTTNYILKHKNTWYYLVNFTPIDSETWTTHHCQLNLPKLLAASVQLNSAVLVLKSNSYSSFEMLTLIFQLKRFLNSLFNASLCSEIETVILCKCLPFPFFKCSIEKSGLQYSSKPDKVKFWLAMRLTQNTPYFHTWLTSCHD